MNAHSAGSPGAAPSDLAPKAMADTRASFHIPSLDGVRTIAFMLVFVAHSGWGHIIPGGFGVTVFFFLSGYLITTLLRREFEKTGRINLKQFYLRRVLRIFPTMYISLAVCVAVALAGWVPGEVAAVPVFFQTIFLTNYYHLLGAFPGGFPAGTGVLWSLAVEEHFYLFFPVLSMVMMPRLGRRGQAILLLANCALVLVWRCVLVYGGFVLHPDYTGMASDTRIDSILLGCVMALWWNPYMDRPLQLRVFGKVLIYAAAVGGLLFSLLYRDPIFRQTLRYTIQGLALAPLFYLAIVDWQQPWFRWLNWKPVRLFGIMTYSLYLVHFTVIKLVAHLWPEGALIARASVALGLSLLFAGAMYRWIETPLARLRKRLHQDSPRPASPDAAVGA